MRSITVSMFIVSSALAATASGAFLGVQVREDKDLDPAAAAAADPTGRGLRVFNLYASFDEAAVPDVQDPASANTVLSVGQPDDETNVRIDICEGNFNLSAEFYQQTSFGGDLPPNPALIAVFPELALDSYVGIGNKTAAPGADSTSTDPDFGFTPTRVFGGWFNSGGSNFQGAAGPENFNPEDGTYDVFIAQFAMLELDPGVSSGEDNGLNGGPSTQWFSDILDGEFTVFTQAVGGGAIAHRIDFGDLCPSPGSSTCMILAAGLMGRRRRVSG